MQLASPAHRVSSSGERVSLRSSCPEGAECPSPNPRRRWTCGLSRARCPLHLTNKLLLLLGKSFKQGPPPSPLATSNSLGLAAAPQGQRALSCTTLCPTPDPAGQQGGPRNRAQRSFHSRPWPSLSVPALRPPEGVQLPQEFPQSLKQELSWQLLCLATSAVQLPSMGFWVRLHFNKDFHCQKGVEVGRDLEETTVEWREYGI